MWMVAINQVQYDQRKTGICMINKSSTLKRNMAVLFTTAFLFGCAKNTKHYADDPNTLIQTPDREIMYRDDLSYANNMLLAIRSPFDEQARIVPDISLKTDEYQKATHHKSTSFYVYSALYNTYLKFYNLTSLPTSPGIEFLSILTKNSPLNYNAFFYMAPKNPEKSYVDEADDLVRQMHNVYLSKLKEHLGDEYSFEVKDRYNPRKLARLGTMIEYWRNDNEDIKFKKAFFGGAGTMKAPEFVDELHAGKQVMVMPGTLPELDYFNYMRDARLKEKPENYLGFYQSLSKSLPGMTIYLAPSKYYLDKSLTKIGQIPMLVINGESHFFVVEDKS